MTPPNANGDPLGRRKQTQSSPQSVTNRALAQAKPEHSDVEGPRPKGGKNARPFARHSIARLTQLLNDSAQNSSQQREAKAELRRRFEEFSSEPNDAANKKAAGLAASQPDCSTNNPTRK
jgi:hypothetical protein